MTERIQVGICVAYDWHLLHYALPLIYDHADIICLSLDKDRISWSGNRFDFDDQSFHTLIKTVDKDGKITVFEDDFHHKDLTPMQNEVRQRNLIADHMGKGGWHIQLDCDEYFIDFGGFVNYLKKLPAAQYRRTNICCAWVTLYKQTPNGFLYVNPVSTTNMEYMPIATLDPNYTYGRRNGYFNIYTSYKMLHQSWARDEAEVLQKLQNWGHKNDFDSDVYFKKWLSVNEENYVSVANIHPTHPASWPSLKYIEGRSVAEVLRNFDTSKFISPSRFSLFMRNSRMVSKIKSILNKIAP